VTERRIIATEHLFLDMPTRLVCVRSRGQLQEVLGLLWDYKALKRHKAEGMPNGIAREWIALMEWELAYVNGVDV
jgi:hypothetical protein